MHGIEDRPEQVEETIPLADSLGTAQQALGDLIEKLEDPEHRQQLAKSLAALVQRYGSYLNDHINLPAAVETTQPSAVAIVKENLGETCVLTPMRVAEWFGVELTPEQITKLNAAFERECEKLVAFVSSGSASSNLQNERWEKLKNKKQAMVVALLPELIIEGGAETSREKVPVNIKSLTDWIKAKGLGERALGPTNVAQVLKGRADHLDMGIPLGAMTVFGSGFRPHRRNKLRDVLVDLGDFNEHHDSDFVVGTPVEWFYVHALTAQMKAGSGVRTPVEATASGKSVELLAHHEGQGWIGGNPHPTLTRSAVLNELGRLDKNRTYLETTPLVQQALFVRTKTP